MSREKPHFFVVDNEETARNQFINLLGSSFVTPVESPDSAYRLLSGTPVFDVALIDLSFPVRSAGSRREEPLGSGVVERVASKIPTAIVIAYSGSADLVSELKTELLQRGADLVCERHELFTVRHAHSPWLKRRLRQSARG